MSDYYSESEVFWTKIHTGGNGFRYIFNSSDLKKFLERNGFCIIRFQDTHKLIHFKNSIAKEVFSLDVFNFCLRYIENCGNKSLLNEFYKQGETLLLSKKGILGSLINLPLSQVRDKKQVAKLFYLNFVVEININDKPKLIPYRFEGVIDGFVWESSIIKRNITINEEESVFEKFIKKVTNDDEHFKTVVAAIGYLLHKHKDPSLTRVIIISDENTEIENKANGGTGKGLIMRAIEQFVNISSQNGKNTDFSHNRFVLQNVTLNTDLIYLDDVKRDFEFEQLFTIITNDMTIEQKNRASFIIPFEFSPKIVITTNYRIAGDSSSHNRRKYTIFLNNYFSDIYTPYSEFKHIFFSEWDEAEWNRFDTFMINCLQAFMENGLIEYKFNNELLMRKIKQQIDPVVYQKLEIECVELNKYYSLKELGLKDTKQVYLYAEYKGFKLRVEKIDGRTNFMFK